MYQDYWYFSCIHFQAPKNIFEAINPLFAVVQIKVTKQLLIIFVLSTLFSSFSQSGCLFFSFFEVLEYSTRYVNYLQVDVILFREFLQWMDERSVSHDQPFLARIYKEDVGPCLDFPNKEVLYVVTGEVDCTL